ncbi:MAG TPA: formyltransferase family protein [Candidatus Binatia bacterium]|nr:formyltransferase family protein [Candidatus Binatia bacterium]
MSVIGFMSGSGSNIRKLLEHQKKLGDKVYRVVALFSDRFDSKAPQIGKEYDIPVIIRDIDAFYAARGKPRKDLSLRPAFEEEALRALHPFYAAAAAYGGYMSILSRLLVQKYIGVNVHPADLSVKRADGLKPKYTGDKAVAKAINAGEKYLRSSTHMMSEQVDCGQVLMISKPMAVNVNETPDQNQGRLKEAGDWEIFPKTLELIAQGRFARNDEGLLYFDGKPAPDGIRLEDLT